MAIIFCMHIMVGHDQESGINSKKFVGNPNHVPPLAGKVFLSRWGDKTAAELIAKWEAEVVDGSAVPPPAPVPNKRRSARGVDQLLRDLGVDK